jgi:hypothetical protein
MALQPSTWAFCRNFSARCRVVYGVQNIVTQAVSRAGLAWHEAERRLAEDPTDEARIVAAEAARDEFFRADREARAARAEPEREARAAKIEPEREAPAA